MADFCSVIRLPCCFASSSDESYKDLPLLSLTFINTDRVVLIFLSNMKKKLYQ